MACPVEIDCPLNEDLKRSITEAAASFPDAWRFTIFSEQEDGFRLRVDGPGITTSHVFSFACAPAEIATFLRHVTE